VFEFDWWILLTTSSTVDIVDLKAKSGLCLLSRNTGWNEFWVSRFFSLYFAAARQFIFIQDREIVKLANIAAIEYLLDSEAFTEYVDLVEASDKLLRIANEYSKFDVSHEKLFLKNISSNITKRNCCICLNIEEHSG
jgi:hypothetical protein